MKAFWDDLGKGIDSQAAREVSLQEAQWIWSDEVHGVKGNFLGLIDDEDRTVQFCFQSTIPDHVDNASHLRIVLVDFPQPAQHGSYTAVVAIEDVHALIVKAFAVGADYRRYDNLTFKPW